MKNNQKLVRPVAFGIACAWGFAALAQDSSSATPALPDVVVTATGFEQSVQSLPFGVSVITRSDIQKLGISSVNEAIMKMAGIPGRVDLYGGGEYSLDLRGFGSTAASNQVVVVDGININEADLGGTRLAGIPIDTVERVEIIRGSGAVLYGQGATGGVILITTKAGKGVERKNQAQLYKAWGTYALQDTRASATVAAGGFSLDASGSMRDSNNHRDNFHSSTDAQSATAQWSNDWVRLGGRYADDHLDARLPGSLTAQQYEDNPSQTSSPTKSAMVRNNQQSVFFQAFAGDWEWGGDVGNRRKALDSKSNGIATYQYTIDASTASARAKYNMAFGKSVKNALTLGYDHADWIRNVLGAYGARAQQSSEAWYLRDELQLGSGSLLSWGVRTEAIESSDTGSTSHLTESNKTWEFGVSQRLTAQMTGFWRLGNSYRLPNVDELAFTQPNTTLQVQQSHDQELGLRWNQGQNRAELRWYRSALSNELGYDPTVVNSNSFSGFGANVNFAPTLRQGVEWEGHWQVNPLIGLTATGTVRQAKFVEGAHDGKQIPLAPQNVLTLIGDWSPAAGHLLNAGVSWVSSQRVDFDNACDIPAYSTWDAHYRYQVRNIELSLGVNNLTDAKYYTQAFRCNAGVTSAIYPEAGRSVTVAVRLRY